MYVTKKVKQVKTVNISQQSVNLSCKHCNYQNIYYQKKYKASAVDTAIHNSAILLSAQWYIALCVLGALGPSSK